MDQLSAHLDRGWDLAQKGDAAGASACGRRALEIDPRSPEVHNLLGFAAALEGDPDDALEHYKQAIALDESYFEAMLNAAEVLAHPLEEWDDAVAMCNDALDYAETDEEIVDCVLLKVEALIGKTDLAEAKRAMAMIPEGPFENPTYLFLIGRAYYEIGETDKASALIEQAAKDDPSHADTQYYLGLIRDDRGDSRGATEAYLCSRAIDLAQPPPAWSPSPETFGAIVRTVVGKLDVVLSRYIREADVYVIDMPGAELIVDGIDPRALLVVDTPPPIEEGGPPRGRIFVYQRNVERSASGLETLDEELLVALEREITAVFLEKPPSSPPKAHQLN